MTHTRCGILWSVLTAAILSAAPALGQSFVTPPTGATVVENRVFDGVGLLIDGRKFDGLIVRQCQFRNTPAEAIYVKNSRGVKIQDCVISGCGRNGILAGYEANSDRLLIEGCDISGCQWSGIGSNVGATNAVIRHNHIWNVALDPDRDPTGHGIYWTATNALVEGNHIHHAVGSGSVGVSMRSSGVVRRNVVHDCTGRDGIAYYSNYPGRQGSLLIENNFVYRCARGVSAEGYNIWNNVSSIVVRFNTLALDSAQPPILYFGVNLQYVSCSAYGNLLVNVGGGGPYVKAVSRASVFSNFESDVDPGFVDLAAGDLHLLPVSPARDGIAQISNYPAEDIDGDPRNGLPVSYGADE